MSVRQKPSFSARSGREPLPIPMIARAPLGSSTWLLRLRSFAVAGQLATILAAGFLTDVTLLYLPLLSLVALTAVTNVIYAIWLRTLACEDQFAAPSNAAQSNAAQSNDAQSNDAQSNDAQSNDAQSNDAWPITAAPRAGRRSSILHPADESSSLHAVALGLMLLDLLTLTAMLYFSGGAGNPFSFFYFVNLAVGGVMIRPKAAWSLTVTAIAGYSFVLFQRVPIEELDGWMPNGLDLRAVGLMLAFATCSSVVTYFMTRTAGELKDRERQLLQAQAAQAASHRLEGLTTLAAGAAHELATPLSTIDVIVRELSRHLEACEKPESVDTDLELIDGQLEMCRQILQRMRSAAGDSMAHRWDRTTVGDLIDTTLDGIRDPHRVDVLDGSEAVEGQPLWVPREAVAQAVRNLIHNGLDASGADGRVRVEPRLVGEQLQISVSDAGQGMSQEVLGRAFDPFFTTKEPGRGIGLGLFLTQNVISQLGGQLEFRSSLGQGTEAVVLLPLASRIAEDDQFTREDQLSVSASNVFPSNPVASANSDSSTNSVLPEKPRL